MAIKERTRTVELPRMGDWKRLANCRGINPEFMFPSQGESTKDAKEVCAGCVVRWECLSYAVAAAEKFGVWGEVGERTRRQVRQWLKKHPDGTLAEALVALDVPEWRVEMAALDEQEIA